MKARRFSFEELEDLAKDAIKLQNDILSGVVTIADAIKTISGDIYLGERSYAVAGTVDEPELIEKEGDITIVAEDEAFERYQDWVKKTWDADKVVTKFIITMLGMPDKAARPVIIPHQIDHIDLGHCGLEYGNTCNYCDDYDPYLKRTYVFKCETCGKKLLDGGIVMNEWLRCSPHCLAWWEKDKNEFQRNPDLCASCGCYRFNPELTSEQQSMLTTMNNIIRGQTEYGYKSWKVKNKRKATILSWSNSAADWHPVSVYRYCQMRGKNPPISLDANQIVVPYPIMKVKQLIAAGAPLAQHPLFAGSFEYKTEVLGYDPISGFTLTSDDEVKAMLHIKRPELEELRTLRDEMTQNEFMEYLATTYETTPVILERMKDWVG
jgi:hypothetical protein